MGEPLLINEITLIKDQLSFLLSIIYTAVYFAHLLSPSLLLDSVLKSSQTDELADNWGVQAKPN